ncbi:MAG: hypothetical protein ACMXYE_05330 [Candidatus Woesearchaeota archaeon]
MERESLNSELDKQLSKKSQPNKHTKNPVRNFLRNPRIIHINILLFISALLIVTILVLLQPAMTGYVIANEFQDQRMSATEFLEELERLKTHTERLEVNLTRAQTRNEVYQHELLEERNTSFMCKEELARIQHELSQLEKTFTEELQNKEIKYEEQQHNFTAQINRVEQECSFQTQSRINELQIAEEQLQNEIQELRFRINTTEDRYQKRAYNTARNICCKAKVDNPSIDSYIVSNNMIICTTGQPQKIQC